MTVIIAARLSFPAVSSWYYYRKASVQYAVNRLWCSYVGMCAACVYYYVDGLQVLVLKCLVLDARCKFSLNIVMPLVLIDICESEALFFLVHEFLLAEDVPGYPEDEQHMKLFKHAFLNRAICKSWRDAFDEIPQEANSVWVPHQ